MEEEQHRPLPIWEPFRNAMELKWGKFMIWVDIEWAKPFSWNSPRGFVWAVVPAMVGFVVFAFALDCYMLLYHRSQERNAKAKERKAKAKVAEKKAALLAQGENKDTAVQSDKKED